MSAFLAPALDALRRGDFALARPLLEAEWALGTRAPALLLCLAVCREQAGDAQGAEAALRTLASGTVSAESLDPTLLTAAAAWLPGGSRSSAARSALSHAAHRMIPKLKPSR